MGNSSKKKVSPDALRIDDIVHIKSLNCRGRVGITDSLSGKIFVYYDDKFQPGFKTNNQYDDWFDTNDLEFIRHEPITYNANSVKQFL